MAGLVEPKVFLVGYTTADIDEVVKYLEYTKQEAFLTDLGEAIAQGISKGEAICSLAAKMCYKTLVPGKNANVTTTRDIKSNIQGAFDMGHGSVFEHCQLNFIVTDCSRVYTHEQVRQRAGWAYSQTSGRYCRLDAIDIVWDKCLDPVKDLFLDHLKKTEDLVYVTECRLGLRKPAPKYGTAHFTMCLCPLIEIRANYGPGVSKEDVRWVPDNSFNFEKRKQLTSAIRRIAPNGQANEIFMSCNIRALRHVVQLRTARFSEREIRLVFNQIYDITREKFPLIFHKARTREYDGLREIYGMKQQPYELLPGDPAALEFFTSEALAQEIDKRQLSS